MNTKCEPHGFENCCNVEFPVLDFSDCLDRRDGECAGTVEYRMSLSGTGTSIPRCDKHWSDRLDVQEGINRRYPDSSIPPRDFDPYYAGESWDSDY